MKRFLKIAGLVVLVLVCIIVYRTLTFGEVTHLPEISKIEVASDPEFLSKAISFETISHKAEMIDSSSFLEFHGFLDSAFPQIHQKLKKEVVNEYSLLYTWEGQNLELLPTVILAHQDVVPAEYSSLKDWEFPPFSGALTEEFIYGRGTLDDKGSLVAIMNAVESLLNDGFKPERTLIFCFGHDEEIGGEDGAKAMVDLLVQRDVRAHMVLDEGGNMVLGIVPGIEQAVALIGTSEKGYLSLELSVNLSGGHSSMPEKKTAVNALVEALYRIEQNPMPNRLCEPLEGFINSIGPELPFVQKMAFANTWLFKPMIYNVYEQSASGSALISTTQATTILRAGIKDNVIPKHAKAQINFRLLPEDEPQEILDRIKSIVADTSVKVSVFENNTVTASPVSDYKSEQFLRISSAIKAIYPSALVSPYLVLAQTDARYFYKISDHVFRFSPITLQKEDLARLHGVNERVSIIDYKKSVNFYATLFKSF